MVIVEKKSICTYTNTYTQKYSQIKLYGVQNFPKYFRGGVVKSMGIERKQYWL